MVLSLNRYKNCKRQTLRDKSEAPLGIAKTVILCKKILFPWETVSG